ELRRRGLDLLRDRLPGDPGGAVEHAGGGGQGDPGVLGDITESDGGHLVSFFRAVRETLSRSFQHNEASCRGGGVRAETSRTLVTERDLVLSWRSPRRR